MITRKSRKYLICFIGKIEMITEAYLMLNSYDIEVAKEKL